MEHIQKQLEDIKNRLRKDLAQESSFIPPPPKDTTHRSSAFGVSPLHSDELRNLNAHWGDWTDAVPFTSHRPVCGRILSSLKNRFRNYLLHILLGDYIKREQQFHADLVRFLNALARHVDAKDADVLRQCVQKIDIESQHENARQDMLIQEVVRLFAHKK